VRKALDARQLSPVDFFEYLSDEVKHALQGDVETPQTLLTTGRRAIGALRQTGQPRGRPKKRAPTSAHPSALDQADFHAWQTRERVQRSIDNTPLPMGSLGPREQRIWTLHTEGWTSTEIAEKLGLEPSTVRAAISHVREKLTTGKRRRGKHTR